MGDWNNEPEVLWGSGFVQACQAFVLDLQEPTIATGGVLDSAICSKRLQDVIQVQVIWDVPWRPHAALQVSLQGQIGQMTMPRLPWEAYAKQLQVQLLGSQHSDMLTQTFGDWIAQAEAYLQATLTDLGVGDTGRGVEVQIQEKPGNPWLSRSLAANRPGIVGTAGTLAGGTPEDAEEKCKQNQRLMQVMFCKIMGSLNQVAVLWKGWDGLYFDTAGNELGGLDQTGMLSLDGSKRSFGCNSGFSY